MLQIWNKYRYLIVELEKFPGNLKSSLDNLLRKKHINKNLIDEWLIV